VSFADPLNYTGKVSTICMSLTHRIFTSAFVTITFRTDEDFIFQLGISSDRYVNQ